MTRVRIVGTAAAFGALVVATLPTAGRTRQAAPAVVGIWYRGTPAGVPVQDELALVRALGFGAIVWPFDDPVRRLALEQMAGLVSLRVLSPMNVNRDSGPTRVIRMSDGDVATLPARAWLLIAGGARVLLLDAGVDTGAGLEDAAGRPAPWVPAAQALARQVDANAELIGRLAPGPSIDVDASQARVVLLDADPAWVLVAANPSAALQLVTARLPRAVPFGPWVSLVDGTDMAMIVRSGHHEYRATLAAGEARVYVIDKTPPVTS